MLNKFREISKSTEHVQKVLSEHIKEFRDPGWLHCLDSNLNPPEEWGQAKLRILFLFLSAAESRAVSATDCVLNNIIKSKFGSDVFVDLCWMPDKENLSLYEKYKLPLVFGAVTQKAMWDFDVIFISNSTVEEKINLPYLLHHSAFPIWYTQRKDKEEIPLLLMGGNSSDLCDSYLGRSEDCNDRSLVDGVFIGYTEGMLDSIMQHLIDERVKGVPKEGILQSFRKFDSFLHPFAFDYQYAENGWHISSVLEDKEYSPLNGSGKVVYNRPRELNSYPGFGRKILHPVLNGNHKSTDIQISQGCSSGGSCSFCKEAHVAGGWREKSLEKLDAELKEAKMWGMSDNISFFSFNTNYYMRYLDLMKLATQNFKALTVIGMRADVVGYRPDYFEFNKRMGMKRITFGIEGSSKRIREGYLNKGLSREELLSAVKVCFENRFLEVKLYLIYTGLEEKEDFDEFIDMMKEAIRIRDSIGANTAMRISVTTLCYYPETPLQWEERRSVKQTVAGERRFTYLIENLRPLGVRLKFTSKGKQCVYPQLVLDLHRKFTPIMVQVSIDEEILYYRNLTEAQIDRLLEIVKQRYSLEDLFAERPDNFIFSNSYVRTIADGYLNRARDLLRAYEVNTFCLATPAKPTGRKCGACGYCKTKEEIESRLHREFVNENTVDDVLTSVSLSKPKYKIRVKLYKNPNLDYLDPVSTWRYTWARLMRELGQEEGLKTYSTYPHISRWCNREAAPDFSSGTILAEAEMKEMIDLNKIKEAYTKIFKELKVYSVVDLREVPLDCDFNRTDSVICIIRSRGQNIVLREKLRSFDNVVKVIDKTYGAHVPTFLKEKLDLSDPLFDMGDPVKGSIAIVTLPVYVNPFAYISSVTGEGFTDCLENYKVIKSIYFKNGMSSCTICGKQTFVDLFTLQEGKYCEMCARRALLSKIKK